MNAAQKNTVRLYQKEIERNEICEHQLADNIHSMEQTFVMFRVFLREDDISGAEQYLSLMPNTDKKAEFLHEIEEAKQGRMNEKIVSDIYTYEDMELPAHRKLAFEAYKKEKKKKEPVESNTDKKARYAKYSPLLKEHTFDATALKTKLSDVYSPSMLRSTVERYEFSLDNKKHADWLLNEAEKKMKNAFIDYILLIHINLFESAREYLNPMVDCPSKIEMLNKILSSENTESQIS